MGNDFDPAKDLIDVKGKVIIVTGGNRGIGYGTVKHLARAGAKVYLAARDEKSASDAIQSLKSEGLSPGDGEVLWLKLDLSDPREAKKSAEEFLKLESRLDVLVNNAASVYVPFELSADGVSTMATVNHISPFVFTRTLIPLMVETARQPATDVRIVNISSIAHRLFRVKGAEFNKIEDLNVNTPGKTFEVSYRYGHSKLLNVLMTKSLQKLFDESDPPVPITVIAVHPGTVRTFIHNKRAPYIQRLYGRLFGVDPERGAYTNVFAAASKQVAQEKGKYKGQYIEHMPIGKVVEPLPEVNEKNAEDLWRITEDFLQRIGI